jgi:hypothetical protein
MEAIQQKLEDNHEKNKAEMDTVINVIKERLKAEITPIRPEFEEILTNWVEGVQVATPRGTYNIASTASTSKVKGFEFMQMEQQQQHKAAMTAGQLRMNNVVKEVQRLN